ncbi:MAG: DUF4342 domain-containing protein [Aldersonia sp.]|nr:DUF4342 domain-containing protein [Aldersonia sp.]
MSQRTTMETIRVEGGQLLDQVKQLIHEGNVRRISIKQDERTVIEIPLTIGIAATLLVPPLAAVGALAALLTDCTIEVEREEDEAPAADTQPPTGSV